MASVFVEADRLMSLQPWAFIDTTVPCHHLRSQDGVRTGAMGRKKKDCFNALDLGRFIPETLFDSYQRVN